MSGRHTIHVARPGESRCFVCNLRLDDTAQDDLDDDLAELYLLGENVDSEWKQGEHGLSTNPLVNERPAFDQDAYYDGLVA